MEGKAIKKLTVNTKVNTSNLRQKSEPINIPTPKEIQNQQKFSEGLKNLELGSNSERKSCPW